MCEKSHTIICLQMFAIFHTCVGKTTDMLISPWAICASSNSFFTQGNFAAKRISPTSKTSRPSHCSPNWSVWLSSFLSCSASCTSTSRQTEWPSPTKSRVIAKPWSPWRSTASSWLSSSWSCSSTRPSLPLWSCAIQALDPWERFGFGGRKHCLATLSSTLSSQLSVWGAQKTVIFLLLTVFPDFASLELYRICGFSGAVWRIGQSSRAGKVAPFLDSQWPGIHLFF